jgi:signal peptidase I
MKKRFIYGFSAILAALIVLSGLTLAFFYEPGVADGISMEPTIYPGEHFFIYRQAYTQGRLPRRGDLIVFLVHANGANTPMLKRVIGIPGDDIRLAGRDIAINGVLLRKRPVKSADEAHLEFTQILPDETEFKIFENRNGPANSLSGGGEADSKVPRAHYFVAGDNRDNAHDSRNGRGLIPFEDILGKAVFIGRDNRL